MATLSVVIFCKSPITMKSQRASKTKNIYRQSGTCAVCASRGIKNTPIQKLQYLQEVVTKLSAITVRGRFACYTGRTSYVNAVQVVHIIMTLLFVLTCQF